MANQTIFDLTAETAMTASHRVPVQDTGASTAAQSATFALMGGLEWDTYGTPNQNNAAVVGKMIGWDISTLSADRNWTLPNDAKLGERCGIFITTGDDAYEVDILTDSTNSQINGVAHGSTSWSRLFISNECLILRCIKAGGADNTDWIVEYDGRIPCKCRMVQSTTVSSNSASVDTALPLDGTPSYDVGDIADTANGYVVVRRDGKYIATGGRRLNSSPASGNYQTGVALYTNSNRFAHHRGYQGNTSVYIHVEVTGVADASNGHAIELKFYHDYANTGALDGVMSVVEVLP